MSQSTNTHESSLLLTLEEISRLVSHSRDSHETLSNIVRLIQERFLTDVCSVYLLEPERAELVLGATVGLKPESVGCVRMRLGEGLTGLTAERMTPVMVEDAFEHPQFKYFPEAGEDPYHSFLGVPLVEGGVLQGVLVVQTAERRTFSANETRMLVTVGSQLAPLVGEARLLDQILSACHPSSSSESRALVPARPTCWRGTGLSPGIGFGRVCIANGLEEWKEKAESRSVDAQDETQRLARAMEAAHDEIIRLSQQISALVGEDQGAILQAQLMILQDRTIEQDLADCIGAGWTAEAALLRTLDKYIGAFQKLTSSFFQERVFDVKDVFRRILWNLQAGLRTTDKSTERLILVAHEASVMDLFSVDLVQLAGVVVERGGAQSHAAILARSLGVPLVGRVADCVGRLKPGSYVLVNADAGMVYLDPSPDLLTTQEQSVRSLRSRRSPVPDGEQPLPGLPRIEANINLLYEVGEAVDQQVAGVGLYRSEFLFLARRTLPTEEEQVGLYSKLLERLEGRPASIRTFDLRPDKLAHHAHGSSSAASALDWRRLLDSEPMQKLFKEQVRAILRATAAGPARILIPLVTRSEQLDFILATIGQARAELRREGLEYDERVPLGIMIEVAAAIPLVEAWAEQVDFFALGTNDLVASALGIDRDDPIGASRHDPLHPGVLRLIREAIQAAHRAGRRVTVCGEMAADPEGILALAAFGVDSVSVPVNQLSAVRGILAAQSTAHLEGVAEKLIDARTARQARELLRQFGSQ